MKIDVFAHILPPRYAERVFELLHARGDTSATDYARMMGLDATPVSYTHLPARGAKAARRPITHTWTRN